MYCCVMLYIMFMTEIVQVSAERWAGKAGGPHHPGFLSGGGPGSPPGRISCQAHLLPQCGCAPGWRGRLSEASCSGA